MTIFGSWFSCGFKTTDGKSDDLGLVHALMNSSNKRLTGVTIITTVVIYLPVYQILLFFAAECGKEGDGEL